MIGSIIGGVAGLANAFSQGKTNRRNIRSQEAMNQANIQSQKDINQQNIANQRYINQQNIDWAQKNYEQSYADSIKRWQMENEYNSPIAQMERLKDAGLNPHLVYGSGAIATGGDIDSAKYDTPNLQAPNLQAPQGSPAMASPIQYQNIMSGALMAAQAEKVRTEAKGQSIRNQDEEINITLRKEYGLENLQRQFNIKMQKENAYNTKEMREFQAWIDASQRDEEGRLSSTELGIDSAGTYLTGSKTMLNQDAHEKLMKNRLYNNAMRAGFEKTLQDIENLKKRAVLYDDQNALNQIKLKYEDFEARLQEYGISRGTTQFLGVLTGLLRLITN